MTESTTTTLPRFGHQLSTEQRFSAYNGTTTYRYHCRCGKNGKYQKTEALTKRGANAHLRAYAVAAH